MLSDEQLQEWEQVCEDDRYSVEFVGNHARSSWLPQLISAYRELKTLQSNEAFMKDYKPADEVARFEDYLRKRIADLEVLADDRGEEIVKLKAENERLKGHAEGTTYRSGQRVRLKEGGLVATLLRRDYTDSLRWKVEYGYGVTSAYWPEDCFEPIDSPSPEQQEPLQEGDRESDTPHEGGAT